MHRKLLQLVVMELVMMIKTLQTTSDSGGKITLILKSKKMLISEIEIMLPGTGLAQLT
ncbi:hypothetical protein D3C72_1060900 [compost metagenome]